MLCSLQSCILTRGEDLDFAEREATLVRSLKEEIAPGRGLRVAVDGRVGAERQGARLKGAGRALVQHRRLGGPRGHVGQSNHEVGRLAS